MGKYKVLWMESCLSVCLTLQRLSLFHPLYPQGSFLVYPLDPGDKEDITVQITSGIPKNSPLKVLVRVYIVKVPLSTSIHHLSCWNGVVFYGVILSLSVSCRQPICLPKTRMVKPTLIWWFGLESSFWTAKIDTSLNSSTLHSESQYLSVYVVQILCLSVCLSDWLSPCLTLSFRVFEFTVSFPLDTELVVKVMDHDLVGADEVIGETRVDLENRFYSRHRASCGLAFYYDTLVSQLHHVSLRTMIR